MGSQDTVWPSQNTANGHHLKVSPGLWSLRRRFFWTKLPQVRRCGFITKIKKQKWIYSHSLHKPKKFKQSSPPESLWLLCCRTIKEFSWNSRNVSWPSLQPQTARLFNVYKWQFRRSEEECCPSSWQCSGAHCSYNKETSAVFFYGKCLITHHMPGLGSLWFSCLYSYEMVDRTAFWHKQWALNKLSKLASMTRGLESWYHTMKKSTLEQRLCREVADRCS